MSQVKDRNTGEFIEPGSAYYFKGWSPQKIPIQYGNQGVLPGQDSHKDWIKNFKQFEDERPASSNSGSLNEDIALACHVVQAREMQKKKAQQIAVACSGKNNKAAQMFQRRYERAERYALVSEPSAALANPENEKGGIPADSSCFQTNKQKVEVKEEFVPTVNENEAGDDVECLPKNIHPELPKELSFFNVDSPRKSDCAPKPWMFTSKPLPPPPSHKDFNRKPRGFVGSYVSPYGDYGTIEEVYETEDL